MNPVKDGGVSKVEALAMTVAMDECFKILKKKKEKKKWKTENQSKP